MAAAMSNCRRGTHNTYCQEPITFAKIQLVNKWSWNGAKVKGRKFLGIGGLWKKFKFKDISPKTNMPPLSGSVVKPKGKDYLNEFLSVNADWYLISGHHSVMFGTDHQDGYYTGFFNHNYHEGRWSFGTSDDPDNLPEDQNKKHWEYEVFLKTAPETFKKNNLTAFNQSNPLMVATMYSARRVTCKGIILAGCYSMAYKRARMAWKGFYPDSLIIGTLRRIGAGPWLTNAIVKAKMTQNKKFWRDPKSVLTDDANVKEFVRQLGKSFPHDNRDWGIGVLFRGKAYGSFLDSSKKPPYQVRDLT